MKLIVLGSGSAFTLKNFQSNFLLVDEKRERNLLLDAGGDVRYALAEAGFSYKDITDVYVSHLHGDHIHGLEWLGRLLIEPRRLWQRYVIGNPLFLWRVCKQRLGRLRFE